MEINNTGMIPGCGMVRRIGNIGIRNINKGHEMRENEEKGIMGRVM